MKRSSIFAVGLVGGLLGLLSFYAVSSHTHNELRTSGVANSSSSNSASGSSIQLSTRRSPSSTTSTTLVQQPPTTSTNSATPSSKFQSDLPENSGTGATDEARHESDDD